MNKILYSVISLFFIFSIQQAQWYSFIEREVNGYEMKVFEHDPKSEDYKLKIWIDTKWGSSLREIMKNVDGISGVTWVFSCPKDYSACWWVNSTVNERYVDGRKIQTYWDTWERAVFGWTEAYEAFIFQTNRINADRENEIHEWLANHPLLILDWVPMTQSYWEKWLIDYKMKQRGTRNFICANQDSSKFWFWLVYNTDIDHLASTLKILWCYNAINLDAWFSTALIHDWAYKAWPGRQILDGVFLVPQHIDTASIEVRAEQLWKKIENIISSLNATKKREMINKLDQRIQTQIDQAYKRYKTDIMEQNFVWEFDKVWTKTEVTDKNVLETIYLLRNLQVEFYYMKRRI